MRRICSPYSRRLESRLCCFLFHWRSLSDGKASIYTLPKRPRTCFLFFSLLCFGLYFHLPLLSSTDLCLETTRSWNPCYTRRLSLRGLLNRNSTRSLRRVTVSVVVSLYVINYFNYFFFNQLWYFFFFFSFYYQNEQVSYRSYFGHVFYLYSISELSFFMFIFMDFKRIISKERFFFYFISFFVGKVESYLEILKSRLKLSYWIFIKILKSVHGKKLGVNVAFNPKNTWV